MTKEKRIYCAWCGEDLGPRRVGDPPYDSCGSPECNRTICDQEREEAAERRWEAEQDDYARY